MRACPAILTALLVALPPAARAQTPAAEVKNSANATLMRLNTDGGFVVRGVFGTGTVPATGQGARLMWHPAKAAFRAGYAFDTQWDEASIGNYSVALSFETGASGFAATALGARTMAPGYAATALGNATTASGNNAMAMGGGTTASGNFATAMGSGTTASGFFSTATGDETVANGDWSTAMGRHVSAGGNAGVFVIGDASTTTNMSATASNRFVARFANGYVLFTSSTLGTGIAALNGANSWSSLSDSTRKTGYVAADGEAMLAGLSRLRLGSWSYRGRPLDERHYGPMAQDFFREFGRDTRGVIGNDTLLATADVDGVLFIAAHALGTRTARQQAEIGALRAENATLAARLAALEAEVAALRATLEGYGTTGDARLAALEALVARLAVPAPSSGADR